MRPPCGGGPVRAWLAVALLVAANLAGCASGPEPAPAPGPASLRGRLVAEGERLSRADLARAVVYLEPIPSRAPGAAPVPAVLRHRDTRLAPDLLAVAPGDEVWFRNDDTLFHGAFSYSKPNAFDLGAYGPGEQRRVQLAHPGPVRVHCPFHPEESSVLFVTPTRFVARPSASGHFEIPGVAPGRYWLRAWADGLPETRYDVTLRPDETAFRNVVLRPTSAAGPEPTSAAGPEAGPAKRGPAPPARAPRPGSPGSRDIPTSGAVPAAPAAPRPRRPRAARAPCPSRRWSA